MGSSDVNPINEAHIARNLVKTAFRNRSTIDGFKVRTSRDYTEIFIMEPDAQKPVYKIGVDEVVGMVGSGQINELVGRIVREYKEKRK